MKLLIQIQNFLEALMEDAQIISKEMYLEVLAESHKETSSLVTELHKFDDTIISPLIGSSVLSSILDRSFEDLYVPYVDDGRYQSAEQAWLQEIFVVELAPFHEAVNQFQSSKGKSSPRRMPSPNKEHPGILTVSNLFSQVTTTMTNMAVELKSVNMTTQYAGGDVKSLDSVLSLDNSIRCIKAAHASTERAKELCRPSEM
jgi:exocyst complex component 5